MDGRGIGLGKRWCWGIIEGFSFLVSVVGIRFFYIIRN